MLTQIKTVLGRSRHTIVQDAVGAASLMIMLMVVLHVPGGF